MNFLAETVGCFGCDFVFSVGLWLYFEVKIWVDVLVCFEYLIFLFIIFLGRCGDFFVTMDVRFICVGLCYMFRLFRVFVCLLYLCRHCGYDRGGIRDVVL